MESVIHSTKNDAEPNSKIPYQRILIDCARRGITPQLDVMGLDKNYQAMPEKCTLLERSRRDPEFGCHLEFFKTRALVSEQQLARRIGDKVFAEFVAEAKQVVRNYTGIEQRTLDLGRHWDMLHYLLSEDRRSSQKEDGSQWIEKAILGGEMLNERTQTTIGSPIRYLSPVEVLSVIEILETITPGSLESHWNPRAMSQANVYKIHPNDDEGTLCYLKEDLENLQFFYAQVAKHGEGVLSFMG